MQKKILTLLLIFFFNFITLENFAFAIALQEISEVRINRNDIAIRSRFNENKLNKFVLFNFDLGSEVEEIKVLTGRRSGEFVIKIENSIIFNLNKYQSNCKLPTFVRKIDSFAIKRFGETYVVIDADKNTHFVSAAVNRQMRRLVVVLVNENDGSFYKDILNCGCNEGESCESCILYSTDSMCIANEIDFAKENSESSEQNALSTIYKTVTDDSISNVISSAYNMFMNKNNANEVNDDIKGYSYDKSKNKKYMGNRLNVRDRERHLNNNIELNFAKKSKNGTTNSNFTRKNRNYYMGFDNVHQHVWNAVDKGYATTISNRILLNKNKAKVENISIISTENGRDKNIKVLKKSKSVMF